MITSTGIGSGLDIGAIVSSLTTAFGAAQTSQLTNQANSLDAVRQTMASAQAQQIQATTPQQHADVILQLSSAAQQLLVK